MSEIRSIFRAEPVPVAGAAVDLVYYPPNLEDGSPDYWTIRLYRDNLRQFNGVDQEAIAHWVFRTMAKCNEFGLVYPEVLEKEPTDAER